MYSGDLMKMDNQVLFLLAIVIIISLALLGVTFASNDSTLKQETFDGIRVSVPSDSNFVKTGDGAYRDSVYGITINTFKNNDSMINFLKNFKTAKVITLDNQPPQSVAFKNGDDVSILVTNGKEGVAIATKDSKLTSKIGNNVVFSNNQKSAKSSGVGVIHPRMNPKNDFDLIRDVASEVDSDVFNRDIVQENSIYVAEEYNINITNNVFLEPETSDDDLSSQIIDSTSDDSSSDSINFTDDSNSSDTESKLSFDECENMVLGYLSGDPNLSISNYQESGDIFIFEIEDTESGEGVGTISVDSVTGDVEDNTVI